jgi:hypothetical protein
MRVDGNQIRKRKEPRIVKVLPSETVPREPFQLARRSQKVIPYFCLSHAKPTLRLCTSLLR